MGFNLRGDKNSLALLSSKRVKAYSRSRADEAFALPSFSDAMPAPTTEPRPPPHTPNKAPKPECRVEHDAEKTKQTMVQQAERDSESVKQTMLQHESVFKEQLHELHRLYQKQCILMVESQTGNPSHPRSDPPSSNSSLACDSDSLKPVEDGRRFRNLYTFSTQMADIKPGLEDTHQHQEQGRARPLLDLERPAEGRLMLDLERPPDDDVATFNPERPFQESMDAEVGKEKGRAMGSIHTLAHASVSSRGDYVKENGDINFTGQNRDAVSRTSRDVWGRMMPDLCPSHDREKAAVVCKDEYGSKERMCEGYFPPGGFGNHISDPREGCQASSHLSNRGLPVPRQDFFSFSAEAASASGSFQGFSHLNGKLGQAETHTSLVQRKPDLNGKLGLAENRTSLVNDYHYIDLGADQRTSNGSSKLPHWLVQPPPTSSKVAAPPVFPPQTSEWQQPKITSFSSQVLDTSKFLGAYDSIPGTSMNASTFQEPYNPWSHGTAKSQDEVSYKQPCNSLPFFAAGNAGATQGSFHGVHFNRVSDENIPSFLPYTTDAGTIGLSAPIRVQSSHGVGRQDMAFDTKAASKELSSISSSRETMTLPAVVLPWYQQKESFSSLMHQASNPEPPFQRESYATSANQWGGADIHQALPRSFMNNLENGSYGMHTVGSNFEGPCLVAAKPDSPRKEGAFDFLSCNAEPNAVNPWKQVDRPFYIGQNTEETTQSSNDSSQIQTRNSFDLNVSIDVAPMEENFDSCHFMQSGCCTNQNQAFKEECDMIMSSDQDMSRVNKALYVNEQLQVTGFSDSVAEKGMGPEVSAKDASQSLFDSSFSTKPGMLCFPRERLGSQDMCTDNCSGDDEAGGGFVEVKSSDASGLTSCESRDVAHLELAKGRDDSNNSSGEACQSRESRIPICHNEEVAFSFDVQEGRNGGGLPLATPHEGQQWGSFCFSRTQSAPRSVEANTKEDYSGLVCTDESEAANNSIGRKDSPEATEIAELLLCLSYELPPMAEGQDAIIHQEKSLDWLANIIPQEEDCEEEQGLVDVNMAGLIMHEDEEIPLIDVSEKAMDSFELAVLGLKPINPNGEYITTQVVQRGSLVENGPSLPTLRCRSSRRGRAIKDFQREILGCMTSLSRHEITEDLQFIEGLIKSTTEEINICAFFEEDNSKPSSSPESGGSQKKARGATTAFRGRRPNDETLNVCSWGESTRRKRMRRQPSQRAYLPPGVVQSSLLENNAGNGALALLM